MKTEELDFHLPPELVARHPAPRRDQARLLRLSAAKGHIEHLRFDCFPDLLHPGDLLVLNDTRVFPARLIGHRRPHGGRVEALLLQPAEAPDRWRAMLRPSRRMRAGDRIEFEPGILEAEVCDSPDASGERLLRFHYEGEWWAILERVGHTPLPPYILKARRDDRESDAPENPDDRDRYQTVYAGEERGSVAAPTAGLHFTPQVLEGIRERGVDTATVCLHVGAGTFQPIRSDTVEAHPMHREHVRVPEATSRAIAQTRRAGGRVVAVGTTVVRALETAARCRSRRNAPDFFQSDPDCADRLDALDCELDDPVRPISGWTRLLIAPGFEFRAIDALLTNFHLPRSSLLALVAALAGIDNIREAYRQAIAREYRFYSYGDCMFID